MKIIKFICYILLLLIFSLTVLYVFNCFVPEVKSYVVFDYKVKSSSLNFKSGYYKIPKQSISIIKLDNYNIYCQTENYFINPGKDTIIRQLPFSFKNAHKTNDWIITNSLNHQYMETPLIKTIKNLSTSDSLMIFMENLESQPELIVFKNSSDTTLIIIKNCNFKRSDYCELGFVFVWPKSK